MPGVRREWLGPSRVQRHRDDDRGRPAAGQVTVRPAHIAILECRGIEYSLAATGRLV